MKSGKSTVYRQPRSISTRTPLKRASNSLPAATAPGADVHRREKRHEARRSIRPILRLWRLQYFAHEPSFSVAILPGWKWAAYVMANLRGGGEYGEAWHQAGYQAEQAKACSTIHRRGAVAGGQQGTSPSKLASAAAAWRPAGRRGQTQRPTCSRRRSRKWACSTCCASTSSPWAGAGCLTTVRRNDAEHSRRW